MNTMMTTTSKANFGTLLGNFVGATLRTVLTEEQLVSWGWRIPFLSGILIAGAAGYLKIYVSICIYMLCMHTPDVLISL